MRGVGIYGGNLAWLGGDMSSNYYGGQAGEIADRGEPEECERCGAVLVADDPNGYDGPLCGPCETSVDDEPGECGCFENRNYGTCGATCEERQER